MKLKHLFAGVFACSCLIMTQAQFFAQPAEENIPIVSIPGAAESVTPTESENTQDTSSVPLDDSIVIADGIYAETINLGGMTIEEAREALTDHYDNIAGSTFTVTMNSEPVTTTLTSLGFTYDISGALSQAAYLGQHGSLIQRYKTLMDLKYDKVVLEIPYTIDQAAVENFVATKIASFDTEPIDATLRREGGEFIVTDHVTGLSTDQAATVQTIMDAVTNELSANMTLAATVTVTTPHKTYEMLSTVSDKLGDFSTTYKDSKSGRKTNIKVAAGNLSGTLLMPGESLSVSTAMKPRTRENGYATGTEYVNGESVESIGGGVCQVSTTLYNALLEAEIQIDERHPHSMLVTYVDPSFDAAIATGSKDLRFTNNKETPIYITASADGATLTFNVYGQKDSSSNRKVEFDSIIIERIESVDKEVLDATQLLGYRETTGSKHDKCTSYLQKKVYENGELVDTIKFETDYYTPSYRTVTIGVLLDPVTGETYPGTPAKGETLPESTEAPTDAPSNPAPEETSPQESATEAPEPTTEAPAPETSGEDIAEG